MTVAEALAAVARLCPPDVHATLVAATRRPAGGHAIGELALRRGGVVEERAPVAHDPRAEPLEETPTRRERRSSEQVPAVVRRPASGHFQAARRILDESKGEP